MKITSNSWNSIIDGPIIYGSRDNLDPSKFFENMCYENLIHDIAVSPKYSIDSIPELKNCKAISKRSFSYEDAETEGSSLDGEWDLTPASYSSDYLIEGVLNSTKKPKKLKSLRIKGAFEIFISSKEENTLLDLIA